MMNELLSIIIPSRNERFLVPTVKGIFEKARGPVEVIVVLDGGEWPNPEPLPERDDLIVIRHPESLGTRRSINDGVMAASGEYVLKCDGHVLFDERFDSKLKEHIDARTVVVPRRKRLDAENWCIKETDRPDIDYEFLSWAWPDFAGSGHNIKQWNEKNRDESLKAKTVDEAFMFQASCYAMKRALFHALDLMDEETYGPLMNEGEEICLKTWLSGRQVLVVKSTWYAHLWKGKRYGRGYEIDKAAPIKGAEGVRKWLTNSAWPKQLLPSEWLIEKFGPLPGWPPNWKDIFDKFAQKSISPISVTQKATGYLRIQLLSNPALVIDKAEYGSDDVRKVNRTETLRLLLADELEPVLADMTGREFDEVFGNPAPGRKKHLSVWCTLDDEPYFFTLEPKDERTSNPRGPEPDDAHLRVDALPDNEGPVPAAGFLPDHGSVSLRGVSEGAPSTLAYILSKFNLDPKADFSKITMPIGLKINRRQLAELFAELGFKAGAEIGTEQGAFAETLCKANPGLKLYCVDKWEPYSGYPDHVRRGKLERCFEATKIRLAPYNAKLVREFSMDALAQFEDASLDMVFIDANHTFDYVMRDLIEWAKKVRPGGVCSGHDWTVRESRNIGVIPAVTAYCNAHRITPFFTLLGEYEAEGDRTPSWMFVKV